MEMWILLLCLSNGWMQTSCTADVTPTPSSSSVSPTEDESTKLVDWLMKYGYLPPSDLSTGQLQAWTAVTKAVRVMQRFAGLKDTGVVDEETMALMNSPRCSLPDRDEPSKSLASEGEEGGNMKRRRRRTITMWTCRNINWRLRSYLSSPHLSRETIHILIFYALKGWAEPTPLEFHEVGSPEAADLQVDFLHGYHGDDYPFDGAGGAVDHAFFPSDPDRAGGIHLDAEEKWTFRQSASEGTDLFTVLVHEFGHALGLAHSSSRHSVMRPYYQGPAGDPLHYSLGRQDLEQITQLYGKRNQLLATDAPQPAPEPQLHHRGHSHHHRHGPSIDHCNTSFDAVARIRGETFFFKGLMMWRVNSGGLVSGRGASVWRLWRGLPPDLPRLHAVVERHSDHAIIFISGSIYLFKGDSYWKFMFPGSSLQNGYPRSSAADWLDCTDSSSSSPVVDDLSLSLSRGRQELRERWREDREEEEAAGKMRDIGRYRYVNSHKDIQDRGSHIWTQCTCKNKALCSRTSYISTLLLNIWTLLAF
ncbi:matrix metalloproteinase-17b [Pagrus major]|uniref:matrix metalloproteinase-17b n=1 Tax=Pagrus major TaxID=143350 RepID=UPI003CC8AA95